MVTGKSSNLNRDFRNFKLRPKKFMCMNDDIDYGRENQAQKLIEIRDAFIDSMFPQKSKYEK